MPADASESVGELLPTDVAKCFPVLGCEAWDAQWVARDHLEIEPGFRSNPADRRNDARQVEKAVAKGHFGEKETVIVLGDRHIFEMRRHRPRGERIDDLVRLL